MKINADELTEASEEFLKASKDIELIIKRLNSTVNKLEDAWSDTNQQVFYQNFKEWETHMGGFSTMLQLIARNMQGIAERFSEADS